MNDLSDSARAATPPPPATVASSLRDPAFVAGRFAPGMRLDTPPGFGTEEVAHQSTLPQPALVAPVLAERATLVEPPVAVTVFSLTMDATSTFAVELKGAAMLDKADHSSVDIASIAMVPRGIEPVKATAPTAVARPVVAADLPADGTSETEAAQLADLNAPAQPAGFGRANGSFTALLPPTERSELNKALLVAAPSAIVVAKPQAKPPLTAPGLGTKSEFQLNIKSQLLTRVDGKTAGKVDFQQTASGLLVRLGSIVEVLGDRYDPAQLARIKASSASNAYLPLADLQAQGIPISYDPVYDEFNVGQTDTRPKAARKVHMDQISAPERGLGSTGMDQVPR